MESGKVGEDDDKREGKLRQVMMSLGWWKPAGVRIGEFNRRDDGRKG